MNNYGTKLLIAMRLCSIVLLTLFVAASAGAQTSGAASVTPPPVPTDIQVEPGNEAFLVGHATGTQNYVCLPCDPTKQGCPSVGVTYALFTPQATLFDDRGGQLTTHFFSPNPFEIDNDPKVVSNGLIRATWQHSKDTSVVWAKLAGSATVTPDSIAWLLLNAKDTGVQAGPTGGDKLTKTTFIQRLNTRGGLAPSTGCSSSADIGNKAYVPYTADYFFYKAAGGKERNDY